MAIVPAQSSLQPEDSAVTLARYAQIIQSPSCAFFGVRRTGDTEYECRDIWQKHDRDLIQRYLRIKATRRL